MCCSTDFPVDVSSLTSSHSSECSSDSSLLKSSEKCSSYGAIQHSQSSLLHEECDLLPLPVLQAKNRFAPLSTTEVLLFQYDPFWRRLRTGMLAFFWLFLLALIVAAGTTAALDTRACSFSPPD